MTSDAKRVLLVEDNADNRYLATYLLEGQGFMICSAVSGLEALAAVAKEIFSLVLLDLQ